MISYSYQGFMMYLKVQVVQFILKKPSIKISGRKNTGKGLRVGKSS